MKKICEDLIESIEEFAKVASEDEDYSYEKCVEAMIIPATELFREATMQLKEEKLEKIDKSKYFKRIEEILNS